MDNEDKEDKEEKRKALQKLEDKKAKHRANMKRNRDRPEAKAKHNEYMKAYQKKEREKYAKLKEELDGPAAPPLPPVTLLPPSFFSNNSNETGKDIVIENRASPARKSAKPVDAVKPTKPTKPTNAVKPAKHEPQAVPVVPEDDGEEIQPMWKKTGIKGVSTKTALAYFKVLANIHKIYTKAGSDDVLDIEIFTRVFTGDYTKDDETYVICKLSYLQGSKLIDFIQFMKRTYDKPNTLKGYINPFVVIASYIDYFKDTYQVLSKIIIALNKTYEDERDDNEITEEDSAKLIDYSPDKIVDMINSIPDITDKLIFALYTLIPPRRLEYASVIITENADVDALNDANYLVIDTENAKKTCLVFHEYKTKTAFDKQILTELPENLLTIIYAYLASHNKVAGDFLFLNARGGPLKNSSFGDRVTKIFTKVYKTHITLRFIRMSYSTYMNSLGLTNNQIKKRADIMAHSVKTNSRYKKVVVTKQ
jgi:hypothetical protein